MKENIEDNCDENIEQIHEVYEYYCQYGERLNSTILKSHKFIKLFRECGLLDKKMNTTRLEIIYKSINKNNQMNFEQFLNSLIKIAQYKYDISQKKDIKNFTQKIITDYISPLYENILNSSNKTNTANSNNIYYNTINNPNQFRDMNIINDMNNFSNINNYFNIINKNFENILYTDIFKEILIQVIPVLFDLYKTFFPNEISISDNMEYIKENSLKNYFKFIKSLEIVPQSLSKSTCYQLYKYETNNNNSDIELKTNQKFYFEICKKIDFQNSTSFNKTNKNIFGKYFKFFKFVRVLVKMSQVTFEKILSPDNNEKYSLKPEEMFVLFLQKMEQTDGFTNFTKVNNTTHNHKTTTIIPPNFQEKIENFFDNNINNHNSSPSQSAKKSNKSDHPMSSTESPKKNNQNRNSNNYQNDEEEKIDLYKKLDCYEPKYINYINEIYGKDLLILYKTIVSFGDQFNFQYMKSKAFLKFLIDSNLVKDKNNNFGLKFNDIDIFFIKLCILKKNNEQTIDMIKNINNNKVNNNMTVNVTCGEIDYPTFIISIEILARLLFNQIPIKNAIDKIMIDFILNNKEIQNSKINEIDEKIEHLKELQNNQEIIDILQVMHKAFYPIFIFYSKDNNNLLSNKNFFQFTKDFEIFPYLIGKAKLNSFFIGIGQYSIYQQNNEIYIEHSLFIDLLALMALELIYPTPEPSPVEKLLLFVEKLSQSKGPSKIVLNTGSNRNSDCSYFIEYFKEAYPNYFIKDTPQMNDFSSIMQNDIDENEEYENDNNVEENEIKEYLNENDTSQNKNIISKNNCENKSINDNDEVINVNNNENIDKNNINNNGNEEIPEIGDK